MKVRTAKKLMADLPDELDLRFAIGDETVSVENICRAVDDIAQPKSIRFMSPGDDSHQNDYVLITD